MEKIHKETQTFQQLIGQKSKYLERVNNKTKQYKEKAALAQYKTSTNLKKNKKEKSAQNKLKYYNYKGKTELKNEKAHSINS